MDLKQEILRLKQEKDVCIIAHCYQSRDICEIADSVGDSYQISVDASKTSSSTILMCGVKFMAQTCKVLSPNKRVLLAQEAGCPMADQITDVDVRNLKSQYPDHKVVCYINTTSEVKGECDVCVTSSSAVNICSLIEEDILFLPDANLGNYVQSKLPHKNIVTFNGCCPYHDKVTAADAEKAKSLYPEALLLVHPECRQELLDMADFVGSTTEIMDFAQKSEVQEFIIGTEESIVTHLKFDCPDKLFYPLSPELMCPEMKKTTLEDVYNSLMGIATNEIFLEPDVITNAKTCIDNMILMNSQLIGV